MVDPTESQIAPVETLARAACLRKDYQSAAEAVLETYGPEIQSFLIARFRGDASSADEAFSDFAMDFWQGLCRFQWRCSIRAWCYKLARSAASRFNRSPHRRAERRAALSEMSFLDALAERTRSRTRPYLRSEIKDEFQKLREKLDLEDQDLLILRVDRELSWRDIAHAMWPSEEPPDSERLAKLEVTLRQRFSEVKKRLRRLIEEAGLLE